MMKIVRKIPVSEVEEYLTDVGFTKDMYNVRSYNDRYYLEVFFKNECEIDYVLSDYSKHHYDYDIDVKKYKNNENLFAVFAEK